jgi:hypothetical protein
VGFFSWRPGFIRTARATDAHRVRPPSSKVGKAKRISTKNKKAVNHGDTADTAKNKNLFLLLLLAVPPWLTAFSSL